MLHSELFDNTKRYAPRAHAAIFQDNLSDERRAALHEAVHALYISRSGDRLFFGTKRHRRLAEYLESQHGWTRLVRLWDYIYRRGPWEARETDRRRQEALVQAARWESTRRDVSRQLKACEAAIERHKGERRDAMNDLATAERNIQAAEATLAACQRDLAAIEAELNALGVGASDPQLEAAS